VDFIYLILIFVAGESKSVTQLHTDHFEEYDALTLEEKTELVQEFEKTRTKNFQLCRDTPRARVQDVANVVRNMKMLVCAIYNPLSYTS
jgi:hypothetical protein